MRVPGICWMLIGAVGLGASLAGHAAQTSIESARLFGSAPALYAHAVQAPYAYLLFAAFVLAASLIGRGILDSLRDGSDHPDWLAAALDGIAQISPAKLTALVLGSQFALLVSGELTEQMLSSYDSVGLGAIFGSGHLTAPFVHVAIGALAAWLLIAFARVVRARVDDIAQFVRSVVALLRRPSRASCAPALRSLALRRKSVSPPLLARHIANRPPPAAAVFVA